MHKCFQMTSITFHHASERDKLFYVCSISRLGRNVLDIKDFLNPKVRIHASIYLV